MLKFEGEKTTTKRDLIVINKFNFAARNLTLNAGLFLLFENAKANGIFELIDTDRLVALSRLESLSVVRPR